ncbi:MAG: RimK-like protein [Candidatus Binataceae bacterium]
MTVEVLILSSLYDFSTDLVCEQLQRLGVHFLRVNRETLPSSRIRLDPTAPAMEYLHDGKRWEVSAALKSVWYRQPVFLRNTPGIAMPVEEQLDRSQWSAFLRGLSVFDHAAWVNHPQATYLAESKPYQLRVAHKLGFKIPATLVTNDVQALTRPDLGDPFVMKSIDTVLLRDGEDELFAYSSIVTARDCIDSEFSTIPVTCQHLVHPKIDLRVTIVGRKVHSVEVTELKKGIEGDWRLRKKEHLQYLDTDISVEVRLLCVQLVQELGLKFGAIDMARTSTGTYFIEINPTGEWGWLESQSRPIATEIAELLANPSA